MARQHTTFRPRHALLVAAGMLAITLSSAAPANAQVCADTQVFLMDSARTNYSLGYENFRNEDWCMALPYTKWILENEPFFSSTEPDERNYRRLAQIYEGLAGMTEGAERQAYVDSSLTAYAQMEEVIAAEGFEVDARMEIMRRGRFYETFADNVEDADTKVFDLYMELYEMDPNATDDYYLNYLGRVMAEKAGAEEVDATEARDFVEQLVAYADDAAYLQGVRESFRVEPIEYFADLHEGYRAGSLDEDETKTLFVFATQMDSLIAVTYPEIDPDALADELLPVIVEFNPTPEILAAMGNRAIVAGRTDEGMDYIRRAIDMTETNEGKRDLYMTLANTMYRRGSRGEAYRLAGSALQFDSNHGPALYLRASVVAGTVNSGTIRGRMAYWCVADMFSRAAAAGGSTAAQARRLAGRYASSGPSRESYFFEGFRTGQTVTTSHGYGSCTTRVR